MQKILTKFVLDLDISVILYVLTPQSALKFFCNRPRKLKQLKNLDNFSELKLILAFNLLTQIRGSKKIGPTLNYSPHWRNQEFLMGDNKNLLR